MRLTIESLSIAHSESVPRGETTRGMLCLRAVTLGYTFGIIHRLLLWMISTVPDLACTDSQRAISGERPNRRGPTLKGKVFTNRGGEAINVQSSTASVTS